MGQVSIRDLQRDTSRVIDRVESSGRPELVTRRGHPVAALVPIDSDELEDLALQLVPSFARSMIEADNDLRKGRTRSAADFFKELDEAE